MKSTRRRFKLATLLCFCLLAGLGSTDCGSKNGEKTPEEIAARRLDKLDKGLRVAALGVDSGIDTVRSFREAGKIEPSTSLKLAEGARDANAIMRETVVFLLTTDAIDEAGRIHLRELITSILDAARRLEADGTLRITNADARLIFDLGVITGRAGLQAVLDEFGTSIPAGVHVKLSPETRSRLESTRQTIDRNAARLAEAIDRLSKM